MDEKRDNSTFSQKAILRRMALARIENPVIMETHGGLGKLFAECYRGMGQGVVFEKKPERAAFLARQRPAWAVYEADCEMAIAAGAGAHLEVNLLDVDPYGDPWPVLSAFFESERPRAGKLVVVVHDGLRQTVKRNMFVQSNGARQTMVRWYGAGLFNHYLAVLGRGQSKS
jgi:hypothetical protein